MVPSSAGEELSGGIPQKDCPGMSVLPVGNIFQIASFVSLVLDEVRECGDFPVAGSLSALPRLGSTRSRWSWGMGRFGDGLRQPLRAQNKTGHPSLVLNKPKIGNG